MEASSFRYDKEAHKLPKLNELLKELPNLNPKQKELICLSKSENGPYTIIEGNHRAIAIARHFFLTGENTLKNSFLGIIPEETINIFL